MINPLEIQIYCSGIAVPLDCNAMLLYNVYRLQCNILVEIDFSEALLVVG